MFNCERCKKCENKECYTCDVYLEDLQGMSYDCTYGNYQEEE